MQVILSNDPSSVGKHNADLEKSRKRLAKIKPYKDQSTVIVIPTRGVIGARTVESLCNLATPMNQKAMRMFISGGEVGEAYEQAVSMILEHPELSTWTYMLTIEEDMLFPADGLLTLIEEIGEYDAVGALYWTKGDGGMPMAYGDPAEPLNFRPQMIQPGTTQEVHGIAMGFSLYKIASLKKVDAPRFKTVRTANEAYTQDLYYCEKARKAGQRMAVTTKVLCGHVDVATHTVW